MRAVGKLSAGASFLGLLALALFSITPATAATTKACSPNTDINAPDGPVCGLTKNGVTTYYGIPFAAAPVGDLRWKPPQPVDPWRQELQATVPGNTCVAPGRGGVSGNEDCLNLNVQVPAGTEPGANLPVMVRIHGAGFLITAFGALPDSSHLAHQVIVVAINYRTGIMGFLAAKALGPHSGDYGIQDQQAGLRWVQHNIKAFGGDPNNVTIFGTSAGGASVCAHTVSPDSAGLFDRGISRSGFYNAGVGPDSVWQLADCKSQWPSEAQAQQAGAKFITKVGCADADDVAECMRALPAAKLVKNAAQVLGPNGGGTIAPIVNGTTIPMSPAKAFATGHVNDVSLIIGADRDEINGGVSAPQVVATSPDQYRKLLKEKYGALAEKLMQLYPLKRYPKPAAFIAFRTAVADADSVCPALTAFANLSQYIPVYAYEVDDGAAPVSYLSGAQPWGAYHGAGGAGSGQGDTADHAALSAQVTAAWLGYARTGDPTAPGAPYWPRYTSAHPLVMSLRQAGDSVLVPASVLAMQHHCDFWNAVTPVPNH